MGRRRKNTKFRVGGLAPTQTQGDTSIHFHSNSRRVATTLVNQTPTQDATSAGHGTTDWMPFSRLGDAELAAIAATLASELGPVEDDDHPVPGKRKRNASDDPMALWRGMKHLFLDELLRGESLGRHYTKPTCAICGEEVGPNVTNRAFRCADCGPYIHCEDCLRVRHQQLPLHRPEVWLGQFWARCVLYSRGNDTLLGLGMIYQLGHHGFACPSPDIRRRRMVVIDVGGVFEVDIQFCGCSDSLRHRHTTLSQLLDNQWYPATVTEPSTCATFRVLDLFRLLKVKGNMNAHDFVGTLERLTNATFTKAVPDRYKAFGRMSRQYDFLLRAKRAGRAHYNDGLASTPPGGLAVRCWACPDPERNLPAGWQNCNASDSYLYSLMLALDANFRLKNRIRANERHDPSLGSGLGYFVELGEYKEHLRHYVAEEDVSTCIAFAALMQKETKLTTGLRVSGVGGCVCARHGIVRPMGLGDLQKDMPIWIGSFLCAVGGSTVKRIVISYDIACQWKQHILERATRLSTNPAIPTNLSEYDLQFALPVWHAAAHEINCQAANSLTHAVGVGRTDGEGIERTWAILNPIGFSTKEMGEGNRHDTIDDKVDHLNFEKNGKHLLVNLIIALAQRDEQVAEFEEIDESLDPALRKVWEDRVTNWNADHNQPNPYVSNAKQFGPTEAQILADLKKAELDQVRSAHGGPTAGKTTAAAFIKGALQLENQQRRIRFEASGISTLTAERSSQLDELRVNFFKKLRSMEAHQVYFMPGVADLRAAEEERRDADTPPPAAENVKLWLPSDLSAEERQSACRPGLDEVEAKLRVGQCGDALAKIRSHLHSKTHLIDTRNANAVGQRSSTRYSTLIGRVGDQAKRQAIKYREVLQALIRLRGANYAPEFKTLHDDDLRVHIEPESDAQGPSCAGRCYQFLGSGLRGKKVEMVKEELHARRSYMTWTKSRARRDRWVEEVALLREEMRRVLQSVWSTQKEWKEREAARSEIDGELAAGLLAYARRQQDLHKRVAESFRAGWTSSKVAAIRLVGNRIGEEEEPEEAEDHVQDTSHVADVSSGLVA
ncbi:CxC2 domain-containing protein [Mycena indigotica]|uniref:CxC2 domain-containing protein n=1 Tax=Mycena indigotica TaxID=2126181 RepID=A0A8H6RZ23_9AGAR|nr:CxC2 domain-containing protein [Mycena indigotica]KAF7289215.1 CxC2 domain-containing protein [Mycena indigotica]